MAGNLFATKPINKILAEAEETTEHTLKRALGPINLITLGIGAIIGAGIFVLTGTAAAQFAGPAIVLSFHHRRHRLRLRRPLLRRVRIACCPSPAAPTPTATPRMGEIVAWIIGWALVLEYAFGAATVAVGWSGFVSSLLDFFGTKLPFNPDPSVAFSLFGHPLAAR